MEMSGLRLGGLEASNRGNISTEKDMSGLLRGREWNGTEIIMSSICGSR